MYISERADLTDNAWVERIGQLRQLIADSYDENTDTPDEWIDWIVEESEYEVDQDDVDFLRREMKRQVTHKEDMMDKQTFAWNTSLRVAEMAGPHVKPEDIDVQIATVDGVWTPTITYYDDEAMSTFRATWHDGESIHDLRWEPVED